MADLTKAEQEAIQDMEYLLKGHRNQIRAINIMCDENYFAQRVAHFEAEIERNQRLLADLRTTREQAEVMIAHEQAQIKRLNKQIAHRRHRLEIEKLMALAAKLNATGVTEDELDALREEFGMETDTPAGGGADDSGT